ncbi:hypothetical protein VNO78_33053 [Psophocarpus tetragonolobus]|uniref:Uncharacterized protein n=1 Tax=Psophocarpus tetragonolobus TaxID=3891 RepID=A0AAN9RL05_PSOTE
MMAKRRNEIHYVTIMIVLCSSSNSLVCGGEWEGTWRRRVAEEDEAVTTIACSEHGRAYLDGLILDGNIQPACECNQCYSGSHCSNFLSDCVVDVTRGNLYFLEPFWMQAKSAILVSGWHRMGYSYSDDSYMSQLLVQYIKKLHITLGNAITEERYIIFGSGSTQLLNAAVYALSTNSSLSPSKVVATAPYFPMYRTQTQFFNSKDYRFEGDTSSWKNISDRSSTRFIEFVASPTNPEGKLTDGVLHGPNDKTIYDHAYYWPHFTPIPSPANEDLMLFTISKLTGHAGSRFGWAIIKDEAIYKKMLTYIELNTVGVSRDTQLRALKLLNVLLEGDGREMFQIAYAIMKNRWTRLEQIMSKSKHFSLQELYPHYCTFFQRVRVSTPAHAWLKCERQQDMNCNEILKTVGINGHEGSVFGADNRHVRLSITGSQDEFEILINKLTNLVAKEYMDPNLINLHN